MRSSGRTAPSRDKIDLITEGNFRFLDVPSGDDNYIPLSLMASALPMMINNVRMYLFQTTCFHPYGNYHLPSIDLKDLIEKHNNMQVLNKKQKKSRKN